MLFIFLILFVENIDYRFLILVTKHIENLIYVEYTKNVINCAHFSYKSFKKPYFIKNTKLKKYIKGYIKDTSSIYYDIKILVKGVKKMSEVCNSENATDKKVVIDVKNLMKIYKVGDDKLHALDGVDFNIYEGEFVAIVGTSGSGKSTLLNMLAGLEKPTSGEISILGKRLDKMTESQLVTFRRRYVGFIFQSFQLIGTMNALENIALPLMFRGVPAEKRKKMALKMLKDVGLEKHKKHLPSQMSGGQQQRVGVARALIGQPGILFADEPTGNLDSNTTKEILNLLRKLVNEQKKTLVMVTHDRNLAQVADRVIHIKDGKIKKIEINEKKEIIEDETY